MSEVVAPVIAQVRAVVRAVGRAGGWSLAILAVLLVVLILLKGRFNGFDMRALAVNALPLVLIALGQFLVILTRGIDLSLGPVASVASSVMAVTISANPAVGLALPLATGLVAGLLNGGLVVGMRLPPIIATLATMSIWQGVALLVLPNPGGSVPPLFQALFMGGFSSPLIGLVTLTAWTLLVTWLLRTRFGLALRAIGSDEQAARLGGIRTDLAKLGAYALAGLLAAVGGMYLGFAMSSGSPVVGDGYVLSSITAVVVGGVPLVGGRGSAFAVVVGALLLTITASLLYFAGVTSFYQSLINGLILFAIAALPALRSALPTRLHRGHGR